MVAKVIIVTTELVARKSMVTLVTKVNIIINATINNHRNTGKTGKQNIHGNIRNESNRCYNTNCLLFMSDLTKI
jgi:hypothetical protein